MISGIEVLCHSSIRINRHLVMYFDPYNIQDETHDADIIFCTHTHYDHFSEEDILKIKNDRTIFVGTEDSYVNAMKLGFSEENLKIVEPNNKYEVLGIRFETVPAYNIDKKYHPKENGWVGYIVEIDDLHYYIAGDTDLTPEAKAVSCDVALIPIGGRFTMNAKEAASLINTIEPQIAIPTHYGKIIGTSDDAELFEKLVKDEILVKRFF